MKMIWTAELQIFKWRSYRTIRETINALLMIAIDEAIENKLWNNFGGLQRLQRDSIQNHCLTLLRYNLPTERCENNWEQAKTSTEVENV